MARRLVGGAPRTSATSTFRDDAARRRRRSRRRGAPSSDGVPAECDAAPRAARSTAAQRRWRTRCSASPRCSASTATRSRRRTIHRATRREHAHAREGDLKNRDAFVEGGLLSALRLARPAHQRRRSAAMRRRRRSSPQVHRRARHLRLRDLRGQLVRAALHQLRQREAAAQLHDDDLPGGGGALQG